MLLHPFSLFELVKARLVATVALQHAEDVKLHLVVLQKGLVVNYEMW